jgi:hypothetical protein
LRKIVFLCVLHASAAIISKAKPEIVNLYLLFGSCGNLEALSKKGRSMKRSIVLLITFFLFLTGTQAQNLDSTIATYASKYDQERCYLHYDKSTYAPGETIWFKAYLMSGVNPAYSSKTFYVDWTDDKGNLLFHSVHPLVDATTNGQYTIPVDYKGRYVHVKAYTKWMLNFDSSFLYEKDIHILLKKSASPVTNPVAVPAIQFFPEGGDAVMSVVNKVAFKANDQWGRPVKIKGIVVNSKGEKVDSLRTRHDGMGYFFIVPVPGETYTAKWKDEKGVAHSTPLPASRATGVSMQVTISGTKRTISLTTDPGTAPALGTLSIIGTMDQFQIFKISRNISSGTARMIVPTDKLPSGILTVTVLDSAGVPLAERITYINNDEYSFRPQMTVERWGLSKRARNEIQITIPDSMDANLSVSVTDMDIDKDSSNTIISHLLLTGNIKGQVNNPAYYFSANNDSISQHLDLVMLTHGWRRFKWEDVVKGKLPVIRYARDTSYLVLSGKVYGAMPSQLRDAGSVILFIRPKKGDGQTVILPVKPNGTFEDPTYVLFDSTNIYYQLAKSKGLGDASVRFMENLLPALQYRAPANGYFSSQGIDTAGHYRHMLLADEMANIIKAYEGQILGNVTVKAKTKTPLQVLDEKYASGLFSGDGLQFDLVNDNLAVGALNIFNYLQGKVAGLQINTTANPPTLQWRGGTPQLYIDEIMAQPDMVSSIPVTDVAYIKVFRPPFLGGFNSAGGAIAIYTRRGNDVKTTDGKGLANSMVTGYTEIRQFYSPNYSTFKQENEKRDIRTTLYWNPQVKIGPRSNKVTLSFYNNDISRAFRVVIEGMSSTGTLTHVEEIME